MLPLLIWSNFPTLSNFYQFRSLENNSFLLGRNSFGQKLVHFHSTIFPFKTSNPYFFFFHLFHAAFLCTLSLSCKYVVVISISKAMKLFGLQIQVRIFLCLLFFRFWKKILNLAIKPFWSVGKGWTNVNVFKVNIIIGQKSILSNYKLCASWFN